MMTKRQRPKQPNGYMQAQQKDGSQTHTHIYKMVKTGISEMWKYEEMHTVKRIPELCIVIVDLA